MPDVRLVLPFLLASIAALAQSPAGPAKPLPIVPGATVVTLWPPDSTTLKHLDEPEVFNWTKGQPDRVQSIVSINNPSIELHLAPAGKATGAGIIVAAGGGNKTLNVGTEGTDIAAWLNGIGISAFILRYRLQPYDSAVDALADTQRSVRTVRAHAREWGVDPNKIGVMGFSAGGEQAARIALNFDGGNPAATEEV